jgi:hypothetical protein
VLDEARDGNREHGNGRDHGNDRACPACPAYRFHVRPPS